METKPLPVGTVLKGKYRIARLVAGGGMAWVYQIEEQRLDRRCGEAAGTKQIWALKELRTDRRCGEATPDDTHSFEEARTLFEQEANILVRLSHPNLPRVSAFFDEGGRSYLVMEFIHGESLEKRLERANAPLMERQVLDWAIQICDVLAYLHTRPSPVIFRDMKPSNVMVTPAGQIKLIDFGIARTYKVGKRKDTITMGSENYAAPEQWGKAQTDPRADIYGLGATMYHLLTNMPPLPAFVPTPRVPVQQYNPAVSEKTQALVDRAMAEDRQQRYPSAQAMREALLDCLPRRERRRIEARHRQIEDAVGARRAEMPLRAAAEGAPAPPTAPSAYGRARPADPTATIVPGARATPVRLQARAYVKPCPACGILNRPIARFCRSCGHCFVPPLPPALTVVRPAGARWEFPLRKTRTLIGRRGGREPVDLDLGYYDPDGYISRNQARITMNRRRYRLTDLDSANGTYVNGQRLAPHAPRLLRDDDRIRLGRVVLRFDIR